MRGISKSWFLLAPAVLLAIEPLRAQAQVVSPTTAPATQSAPAANVPPNIDIRVPTRTTGPATTQNIKVHFENASVDAVLEHLSRVAGLIIVKATNSPIDGRVTISDPNGLTPAEAVTLLNTVLKNSGYVALRQERILKVITTTDAKKEAIPVFFGADPKSVPVSDDLITQVIPIKTVDATKLKQDLTAMFNAEADVSANSASNVLIITDRSSRIHRIVEVIANLDKRDPLDSGIRVKQLKFADAAATAKLITDIFKSDDQQGSNSNLPPQVRFFAAMNAGRGGPGGGRGSGSSEDPADKSRTGKIVASSDQRTNTVVVTGPEETLKVIDKLLTDLDSNPLSEQTFFIYSLKNAQAANLQTVLNSLFAGNTSASSGNRTGTNTTGTNRQTTSAGGSSGIGGGRSGGGGGVGGGSGGLGGASGTSTPINRSNNTSGGSGYAGGAGGGNRGIGAAGGQGGASSGGLSDLTGQVYVVADTDTNSLLVATATKYQDQVTKVIQQLDRPVAQVLIKVLIAEVTHDNSEDLGVDFSFLNTSGTSSKGSSIGQNLGTAAAATSTGGLVVNLVERDINVTLRALQTAGKIDVLSRPYILASDNQQATMTVGSYVPFVTDTRIDSLGGQTNTIQYQDIGIILNVTPHINPDGMVILDVAPEISSLTQSSVTVSNGVTAPIYAVRSADTRVGIMNGQTIVIGGLMQDQKTSTLQKIPILGDIPLLGRLFQRNQVDKTKTELLIFLTPHVAQRPDILKGMSADELKGTKLTPGAVEPGIFDDQIRGMQRGATKVVPQDPASDFRPPTTAPTTQAAPRTNEPQLNSR